MASWTDHPVRGVIAGLLNRDGELVMIGRTVPLTSTQSAELAAALHGRAGPPPARRDLVSALGWPRLLETAHESHANRGA